MKVDWFFSKDSIKKSISILGESKLSLDSAPVKCLYGLETWAMFVIRKKVYFIELIN